MFPEKKDTDWLLTLIVGIIVGYLIATHNE